MNPLNRFFFFATASLFGFVIVCELIALLRDQLRDVQMMIAEEALHASLDMMPLDHPRAGLYRLAIASFTQGLDYDAFRPDAKIIDLEAIIKEGKSNGDI